ncbi:hypothetical protein G5B46_07465 [Caulobacter sp. 602-2]|uniref:Uncharacterized protein n=1 Tax=Caulobacter sp. 602-2 TaxID=2710887 RepID=A0A6G4QVH2_9CAUL|nr:hypothetical protein [Caulobacter sp. 602-2]NGM49439.1 hypothetical protein [Caulobacter sp. 602-2]
MGLDQTRSLAPYTSVMAEKSEQIDALLTEIRDLIVETYHGAAKELLIQVKDEPPKVRLDASKQVALVGRPVEMLHAARLRSQKISAAKQARIAKAVGEEMAMNDDEPWTEDRIERLHAALERRLGAVAQSAEFKSLVRERLDEECRARGAPLVETGGSSDAA